MKHFWQHSLALNVRQVMGEAGLGLGLAWWFLFLLELIRPGLVSLYLDLNLILAAAVVLWLLGTPPAPLSRPYTGAAASAVLVAILGLTLVPNSAWLWLSLPLGAIAGLLWYVAQQEKM
ncbi:MAG: hypothetical protein HY974_00900 [Candidatus Kerfeldbacteria bacterium]|nr:hypothetical protein [Candidatus Kerfeldbacteria bacterium]